MRRKTFLQIIFFISILFVIGCTYLGYNYLNYLSWLMDYKNITALNFSFISIQIIAISILCFRLKKEKENRKYYANENNDLRENNFMLKRDKTHQSEIIQDLKLKIKFLEKSKTKRK